VLSELPDEWERMLQTWSLLNVDARSMVNNQPAPARNDEYLLYQALLGIYQGKADDPVLRERLGAYMHKAINEAKVHSNWVNQNAAYADAVTHFIAGILDNPAFIAVFEPFQKRISLFGKVNALAQTLLKLTSPGMPDIYQGQELWDYSLVDPDNRRPVNYAQRKSLLNDIKAREGDRLTLATSLLNDLDSGEIKLYVTAKALHLRYDHQSLFTYGDYLPVTAVGSKANHVVAFARVDGDKTALVVVPRLVVGLTNGESVLPLGADIWGDTVLHLPESLASIETFSNLYTGESLTVTGDDKSRTLRVSDVLGHFPVALLETMV
jgi:(1->4)-alpha-D-glucan 1-alpha-D-glucosylmutase